MAGCQAQRVVQPTITRPQQESLPGPSLTTGMASPSPTWTPASTDTPTPTDTPAPTATNTAIPATPTATPLPFPNQALTAENAGQLALLAQWGKGVMEDMQVLHGGKILAVSYLRGTDFYRLADGELVYHLDQPWVVNDQGSLLAAYDPSGGTITLHDLESGELLRTMEHALSLPQAEAEPEDEWAYYGSGPPNRAINWLRFSADGEQLWAAYGDGAVIFWDTQTDEQALELKAPADMAVGAVDLVLSPDKSMLAVVYGDGRVTVWNPLDGAQLADLQSDILPWLSNVLFSADGKYLAVESPAGQVLGLWLIEEGKLVWRTANGGSLLAFAPDGGLISEIAYNLVFWDLNKPKVTKKLPATSLGMFLGFSEDGKQGIFLDQAPDKADIQYLSLRDGTLDRVEPLAVQNSANAAGQLQSTVAVHPDGRHLVLLDDQNRLVLYDYLARSASTIIEPVDPPGELRLADQGRLATVTAGNAMTVWQVPEGSLVATFDLQKLRDRYLSGLQGTRFLPDGKILGWGSGGSQIFTWDVLQGAVQRFDVGAEIMNSVMVSADGKQAAVSSSNGVELINLADGGRSTIDKFKATGKLAFSPDGHWLARAGQLLVQLYGTLPGTHEHDLIGHRLLVTALAFSPDGLALASGSEVPRGGGEVLLWKLDPPSYWTRFRVTSFGGSLTRALAISPNLDYVFGGGADENVSLWRIKDGHEMNVKVDWAATALAVSPDGGILAAGDQRGNIWLWSIPDWQELAKLRAHAGPVASLEFSQDGNAILSAGEDGTVKLWGAP